MPRLHFLPLNAPFLSPYAFSLSAHAPFCLGRKSAGAVARRILRKGIRLAALATVLGVAGGFVAAAQAQDLPSAALISKVKACVQQERADVARSSLARAREVQQLHGAREVPISVRLLGERLLGLPEMGQVGALKDLQWWGYASEALNAQAAGDNVLLLSSTVWEGGLSVSQQAAVIAHELAHLVRDHVPYWHCLQRQSEGQRWLAPMHRDMEKEADDNARRWLSQAGFDAQALDELRQRQERSAAPASLRP